MFGVSPVSRNHIYISYSIRDVVCRSVSDKDGGAGPWPCQTRISHFFVGDFSNILYRCARFFLGAVTYQVESDFAVFQLFYIYGLCLKLQASTWFRMMVCRFLSIMIWVCFL